MNITSAFADLYLNRPPANASAAVVAQWYDAKATLHETIAAQETGLAAARERSYANAARDHARVLRREVEPLPLVA